MGEGKMKMRKKIKKKWILAAAVLVLAGGVCALLWLRPDWRFLAFQQAKALFSEMKLQELDWEEKGETRLQWTGGEAQDAGQREEASLALLLVNEEHPVPESFHPELVEYKDSGVLMQRETAEAYEELSRAVQEACGERLLVKSSYRNREEQKQEYEEDSVVAAVPGTSEHETGLALDVYVAGYAGYGFLKSPAGQFVNESCWEYGFVIRYPLWKEKETGIPFEPWHLRYVGKPHAELMHKNGWTLEEYLERLEPGRLYETEGSFVTRQESAGELRLPAGAGEVKISPDNCGNWVAWGAL